VLHIHPAPLLLGHLPPSTTSLIISSKLEA
jgi:hypothetical protein